MKKLLIVIFSFAGLGLFSSCQMSKGSDTGCAAHFKKARDLAFRNPADTTALYAALAMVNESMECDSVRLAAVDLKIRLLLTLRKYGEGMKYTDSLQAADFIYSYKKPLIHGNFAAFNFAAKGDTASSDSVYRKMAAYLETYIQESRLKPGEFQEAFTELNSLQERFMDSMALKAVVDSFKRKYPDEERFFEFFKK